MAEEVRGWYRQFVLFGGIFVVGAIMAVAIPWQVSPNGAMGPTMLQAQSPLAALVAVAVCFGLATVVAVIVARQINSVVGLFVLGAGTSVLALRSEWVVTLALGEGSLRLAALETAIWAALVQGATLVLLRYGGQLRDVHADEDRRDPIGVRGLAACLGVIPLMWLLCRSPMRGQTLAAATLATMVVGLAARLLSPQVQPRLLFALPVLVGAAGLLAAAMTVEGPLSTAWIDNTLPRLAYPRPIDYAAGSLMGIAMGLGWARSFLHHEPDGRRDAAGSRQATTATAGGHGKAS